MDRDQASKYIRQTYDPSDRPIGLFDWYTGAVSQRIAGGYTVVAPGNYNQLDEGAGWVSNITGDFGPRRDTFLLCSNRSSRCVCGARHSDTNSTGAIVGSE